jgi:hypothetical protein
MIIMWDSNGGGSSSGSTSHSNGPLRDHNILINSNVIPEFPGLMMFSALLIATAIAAILLKRRITTKPVANITS